MTGNLIAVNILMKPLVLLSHQVQCKIEPVAEGRNKTGLACELNVASYLQQKYTTLANTILARLGCSTEFVYLQNFFSWFNTS